MTQTASIVVSLLLTIVPALAAAAAPAGTRVRISFPVSVRADAVTGRVYVALNRVDTPTTDRGGSGPVQQAGPTGAPLFGVNVESLKPGAFAEIDGAAFERAGQPLLDTEERARSCRSVSCARRSADLQAGLRYDRSVIVVQKEK